MDSHGMLPAHRPLLSVRAVLGQIWTARLGCDLDGLGCENKV
jgi:hypothetical protein